MRKAFEVSYEAQYGLKLDNMPVEFVAWRLSALGPAVDRHGTQKFAQQIKPPKGYRKVLINDVWTDVAIYDRLSLCENQKISGPAIIEERETTIFLLPRWKAVVSQDGCVIAERI